MALPLGWEAAFPAALWGLCALLPLAILQLYARRRRRVVVPFAPLLLETLGPTRHQAWFRRLREGASLLLRALALAGVVLGLAAVRPAQARAPSLHTVLIVDDDATLGALEPLSPEGTGESAAAGSGTRGQRSAALLRAWVGSLASEDGQLLGPLSVVVARAQPELRAVGVRDVELAQALAEQWQPAAAAGPADLGRAIALARDVVARIGDPARIVLLSSRIAPEPEHDAQDLLWQGVGTSRDNARIVGVGAQPLPQGGWRLVLRVDHEGEGTRELAIKVEAGERELARVQQDVAPAELGGSEFVVEVPASSEGLAVRATLQVSDDFERDNRAYLWLPPRVRPSVLLVHGGVPRPYSAAALEALTDLDVERSGMVRAADLAKAELRDVNIVDGVALPDGALRPGAWVFLAPLGGALPFELGPIVSEPLVWRTEAHHPLLEGLDLSQAFAVQAVELLGPGFSALAYAEGAAVLGEGERDGVRYVVLGIDPEGSALPVRAAFPLLVRNAVRRLFVQRDAPLAPVYRPGETWPLAPASQAAGGLLCRLSPSGREVRSPPSTPGQPAPVPLGWEGWVSVEQDGAFRTVTAVSDLDAGRRILPARPLAELPAPAPRLAAAGSKWRTTWLLLAAALLLADLFVLGRLRRRDRPQRPA